MRQEHGWMAFAGCIRAGYYTIREPEAKAVNAWLRMQRYASRLPDLMKFEWNRLPHRKQDRKCTKYPELGY